jgi:formimidoylglutamate deiminase
MALDTQSVTLVGRTKDQLIDSFIFAGDDDLVRDVWSAGRHLVTGGRHIAHDKIASTYRVALASLRHDL